MYSVDCTIDIHSIDGIHLLTVEHILIHVQYTLHTTLYNRRTLNRRGSFTYSKPHFCTCTLYTTLYNRQTFNRQTGLINLHYSTFLFVYIVQLYCTLAKHICHSFAPKMTFIFLTISIFVCFK